MRIDSGESMSATATASRPLHTGIECIRIVFTNLKNDLNWNTAPELNKYRMNPIYLNTFSLDTFLNTPVEFCSNKQQVSDSIE